jgi:hypothetical protein
MNHKLYKMGLSRSREGVKSVSIKNFSTKELVEELSSRTEVMKITAGPSNKFSVNAEVSGMNGDGPAVILVVKGQEFVASRNPGIVHSTKQHL